MLLKAIERPTQWPIMATWNYPVRFLLEQKILNTYHQGTLCQVHEAKDLGEDGLFDWLLD